jgi:hypothetical protein
MALIASGRVRDASCLSFHRREFVGFGFGSYGYYDDYPYAYNDDYYDDGGCYVVRRRVHTRYGWRVRPVQICG